MTYATTPSTLSSARPASASLVTWSQLIYALHAISIVSGIVGTATIIGAFLFGWPSIIAVILTYVKRGAARGTWLESHFRWQLRTFWFGLLWATFCLLFVIFTLGIGLIVVWVPVLALAAWVIYRVARGWMAVSDGRPMPM